MIEPRPRAAASGEVVDFDPVVGLGFVLVAPDAGAAPRRYLFHCTQIADGSRTVANGARVRFRVVAGRLGTWEAASLIPA